MSDITMIIYALFLHRCTEARFTADFCRNFISLTLIFMTWQKYGIVSICEGHCAWDAGRN